MPWGHSWTICAQPSTWNSDRMKKALWIATLLAVAMLGYAIAGPFLAVNAIRDAVRNEDARSLSRHVDFPPLRASLKRQVRDAMLRKAGDDVQSSVLGTVGMFVAGSVSDAAVDAMVTPIGLGALMQGRKAWNLASGTPRPAPDAEGDLARPLQDARYRFESHTRFTATVTDARTGETIFVFTRKGLRWKLSDIRLPV